MATGGGAVVTGTFAKPCDAHGLNNKLGGGGVTVIGSRPLLHSSQFSWILHQSINSINYLQHFDSLSGKRNIFKKIFKEFQKRRKKKRVLKNLTIDN